MKPKFTSPLSASASRSDLPVDPARSLMGAQPDPPTRNWMARVRRRIGRELVMPFVWLMELGHRFGRVLLQTEYRVGGGCDKRGACCHHVLMEWSPWLDRYPWMGRIVLWKLTRFYSFYDKGYSWEVQDGLLVRVLGCHALQPDGRCGEYRLRPLFCRTYPEVPLTGRPLVLQGCGYRFERRDGQPDRGQPVDDNGSDRGTSVGRGSNGGELEATLVQIGGRPLRTKPNR